MIALGWRREFIYRERLGLSSRDSDLIVDGPPVHVAPAVAASSAVAWRNYLKLVFQKGFMYRISYRPSVIIYVSENKTLAGKEDRFYDGDALGRKLVITFFEDADGGLVRRVDQEGFALRPQLLTVAEVLQTLVQLACKSCKNSFCDRTLRRGTLPEPRHPAIRVHLGDRRNSHL